jgi:hypothetical protein
VENAPREESSEDRGGSGCYWLNVMVEVLGENCANRDDNLRKVLD